MTTDFLSDSASGQPLSAPAAKLENKAGTWPDELPETGSRPQLVIVEDERSIAELLEFNLQNEGYACTSYSSGKAMFDALERDGKQAVNLFIVDLMLPDMDGFEICERLRREERYQMSLIMILTARGSEQDKVRGLDIGADDYVTKPFGMREFIARVRALIRRQAKLLNSAMAAMNAGDTPAVTLPEPLLPLKEEDGKAPIACFDLVLDDARHKVLKSGRLIEMTHREYELLKFLMLHRGNAYSRDDLLNYVWGYDYSGETRTVDVHIRQLRRKVEDDSSNPQLIETVRGFGYRFRDEKE